MKRFLFFILPCILAACAASPVPVTKVPTESAFERTKLFAWTAEAETVTSGYPANNATITAILATKYAGGTEMAETMIPMRRTMTAIPTPSSIPTISPDSPPCQPADLTIGFSAGPSATGGLFFFSARLTNASDTPCYLQAWPQVLLVDRQDRPLDVDYNYFDVSAGDNAVAATEQIQESATARIGLWPGWSTWLNLNWANWCGSPISGGVVIRLTLIDNTGVINIPTDVQAFCVAPGFRSDVGISKLSLVIPPP